jgi:FkbM family methyltransferase
MTLLAPVRSAVDFAGKALLCLGQTLLPTNAERRIKGWLRDDAEDRLRLGYDLNDKSLILDVGGYRGRWASDMYSRFSCRILVFEPVPHFSEKLQWRFSHNPRITVYPFGLSNSDRHDTMYLCDDGTSSIRRGSRHTTSVVLRRAADFLSESEIATIDLMKINIEGDEYDLLDHLHESGWIPRIRDLQIQFHDFHPDAGRRMRAIQEKLAQTHRLTYSYPFVWENWRKR